MFCPVAELICQQNEPNILGKSSMHAAEQTMRPWLNLCLKPVCLYLWHWSMSAVKLDSNCTCAVADFWVNEPHN